MESLNVRIAESDLYDQAIRGNDQIPALKEGGDLQLITKNGAMVSGRAAAVLTFTVEVDGKLRRAQAVVPVRLLKAALRIIDGAYNDEGMPR